MALNIFFNANDEKQDGYLDSFDSQGRGIDQQFVRGDQSLAVSLRPLVPNTSTNATRFWNDDHKTGDTYQVAIGNPDQAPSSGTFPVSYESVLFVVNSASSAAAIQALLNDDVFGSEGGVVVSSVSPGVFQVTWNNPGARGAMDVSGDNTLTPTSRAIVIVEQVGDSSTRAIQYIVLRQSPVAYCEPSTAFPAASVSASVTQAGDGTHNKKVAITLTPGVYAGSFSVTLTKADSTVVNLVASGTIKQDAFATLLGVPCNVTRENDVIRVEFTGSQGLSNTPSIAVSNIDLLTPKGVSGLMDLNTVSLYRQFWQSGSSTSVLTFTLSIKRTRTSGEIAEIFQHPVTLKRNIIDVTTMVDVTLGSYYTAAASDARYVRIDEDGGLVATVIPLSGTAAALAAVVPLAGQVVYITDTKETRVGDGTTAVASLPFTATNPTGLKIYCVTITQSGTSDPVPTVLENTLGTLVWERVDSGIYTATLAGAFPNSAKVFINDTRLTVQGTDVLGMQTASDGVLSDTGIEIRVYA